MTTILGVMTDAEVLLEVATRLRAARLDRNASVEECARAAGMSRTTWTKAESGGDIRLETLVRMLRALGRVENLETFLPPVLTSPVAMVERRTLRVRERASGGRGTKNADEAGRAPIFDQPGGVAQIGVTRSDG